MEKIDYKAEVKKVYPDVICKHVWVDTLGAMFVVFKMDSIMIADSISGYYKLSKNAWRSAYDNLLAQGKITPTKTK